MNGPELFLEVSTEVEVNIQNKICMWREIALN